MSLCDQRRVCSCLIVLDGRKILDPLYPQLFRHDSLKKIDAFRILRISTILQVYSIPGFVNVVRIATFLSMFIIVKSCHILRACKASVTSDEDRFGCSVGLDLRGKYDKIVPSRHSANTSCIHSLYLLDAFKSSSFTECIQCDCLAIRLDQHCHPGQLPRYDTDTHHNSLEYTACPI